MRISAVIGLLALMTGGCERDDAQDEPASQSADAVPPPPSLPASAGLPPPVAPPPPGPHPCLPYPPNYTPPPGAPSAEECAAYRAQQAARSREEQAQRRRDYVRPEFVPFAERKQHPAREGMGSWINRLQPAQNGICRFTEKPNGSVPADYMRSAMSGNMDLWEYRDTLMHDHAIGFVEAGFAKSAPIVAVRKGLPDLWIEPVGNPRSIILFIGQDRFECVRLKQP